jgi:hypothetical protein
VSVTGRYLGSPRLRYWITDHAVIQFRARASAEHRALDNDALRAVLDDRIADAFSSSTPRIVIDSDKPDEDTTIIEIFDRDDTASIVVLRQHYDRQQLAAITVLTPDMAASSYASGKWTLKEQATAKPEPTFEQKLAAIAKPSTSPPSLAVRLERAVSAEREAKARLVTATRDVQAASSDVELLLAELTASRAEAA